MDRYLVAVFACVLLATVIGCQRTAGPVDSAVTAPTALPSPPPPPVGTLSVTPVCFGPFRPGSYAPLACVILVDAEPATRPLNSTPRAFVDLRVFGLAESWEVGKCVACGFPPVTFDMDLRIPAETPAGVKTFRVWATDAEGRSGMASATIEISAR
jgi:hypothetical protein